MSSSTQPLTWLVTGASSGIGQAICIAALAAGHKVGGATRDIAKASAANPDFAARGGIWVTLDPGHPDSAAAFAAADKELGGVDVLVNNAGYWYLSGVEDMRLVGVFTTSSPFPFFFPLFTFLERVKRRKFFFLVLCKELRLMRNIWTTIVNRFSASRWRLIFSAQCAAYGLCCLACGLVAVAISC
jgi:NAD(P)-dependent dehydrogenase (short-subunit alcohol dehydrogenase family)